MKTKLAGHFPLQDALRRTIQEAKLKIAASEKGEEKSEEKKEEKKAPPFGKKDEKKETKKEEAKEKESSAVVDFQNPDEVEKLAASLDFVAEKIADYTTIGGESHQGGEVLPVQSPAKGKQVYPTSKGGKSPAPAVKATKDNPGPANAMATDDERAPGGTGAKYPAHGVLKTGGVAALKEVVAAQLAAEPVEEEEKTANKVVNRVAELFAGGKKGTIGEMAGKRAGNSFKGFRQMTGEAAKSTAARVAAGTTVALGAKKALGKKEKKSSAETPEAVQYILGKISTVYNGGESHQGGEQLSNTMPVTMQPGRSLIQNKDGIKNVTKPEAKAFRKKELAEVLSEPASHRGVAPNISGNLRSAASGGVKTAAKRALLSKIAGEGCKCTENTQCRHCHLKEATASLQASAQ
jgi:hypothetical protein